MASDDILLDQLRDMSSLSFELDVFRLFDAGIPENWTCCTLLYCVVFKGERFIHSSEASSLKNAKEA